MSRGLIPLWTVQTKWDELCGALPCLNINIDKADATQRRGTMLLAEALMYYDKIYWCISKINKYDAKYVCYLNERIISKDNDSRMIEIKHLLSTKRDEKLMKLAILKRGKVSNGLRIRIKSDVEGINKHISTLHHVAVYCQYLYVLKTCKDVLTDVMGCIPDYKETFVNYVKRCESERKIRFNDKKGWRKQIVRAPLTL